MRKKILLISCIIILLGFTSHNLYALDLSLPELGNTARGSTSAQLEKALGRTFVHQLHQQGMIMDDPLTTDYLQQLGERLASDTERGSHGFQFMLIDRPEINAFAGPDGHIGIHTGLFLTTQTESELASVLAHEIAHSTQQHLLRAWEDTSNLGFSQAAIVLAAIILGAAAGGDAGMATASIGQAAMQQQRINFTRANEKEADRIGIRLMAKAGFEPRAMAAFFSRINQANRIYESQLPEFLLTHPVTNQRTAEALDRAQDYPYSQLRDELRYHLIRERLKWRTITNPQNAINDYDNMLAQGRYRDKSATEYGRALVLYSAGKLPEAANAMSALIKQHPRLPELHISQAYIEAENQQTSKALQRLQKLLEQNPKRYAAYLAYAEIALANQRYRAALEKLQTSLQYLTTRPKLYELLARAAGNLALKAQASAYLAEKSALSGDYATAVLQLEDALKQPKLDFYQSAKFESRLQELRLLRDEQEAGY